MAQFKVDTDILLDTINTYTRVTDDIENAIKEAEQAIEVLKTSGWKTNASKVFFENFDSGWKSSINNRLKVIKHLKSCLEQANTEYISLCMDASQIGNPL